MFCVYKYSVTYMIKKGLLIILLVFGLILIIIELTKVSTKCPAQKIVYRYIPRTLEEEEMEPAYVTDIFKTMFTQPSVWIGEVNDLDTRKREQINKFFISQL
jgi:hypothetical protein